MLRLGFIRFPPSAASIATRGDDVILPRPNAGFDPHFFHLNSGHGAEHDPEYAAMIGFVSGPGCCGSDSNSKFHHQSRLWPAFVASI